MNILIGLKNFLDFLDNNWTAITSVVIVAAGVYKKIDSMKKADFEVQLESAKKVICETMLNRVCRAEDDYAEWVKAGAAKRAQVIDDVLATYPILMRVSDKDEIIAWLDGTINDSLKTMRKLVEEKMNNKA